MRSRNAYRNPEQRNQVRVLHGSLLRVQAWADAGEREAAELAAAAREEMTAQRGVRLDYFEIVVRIGPDTLDSARIFSAERRRPWPRL
jgi:pantothenate synthetase